MSGRRLAMVVACAALIALAGCGDGGRTGGGVQGGGAGGRKLRLAFVTNNSSDFWTIARAGCQKADEELANVEVEFRIPSQGTAAEQKRVVDDLLAAGIDGIAISPVDPANQTRMLNETARQTLLITHDSDAAQSERACYVGTSNVDAGREAGKLIKEALPDGGKIMVFVGMKDAQNAKERFQGIQEELNGSKVEIVDLRTDDTDRMKAKKNVLDTLVSHEDIGCLVGLWSYNGPAILNAVKESKKEGKVKIVCFDEEDDTLAGVKEGSIFATVVQQPYEFGYQAIHLMARVLGGDRSVIPESKVRIVPTLIVRKDNVEEFHAKLKKLRGK